MFFMIFLPHDTWEIKQTEKKGKGVFAKKDILPGEIIGDYIGKVIKTAEEDTVETDEGLYLMYYHDRASLYPVDIKAPGIHLLNHSCAPNCWMYTYHGHTLFFAIRHIFAGEELTVSYLIGPNPDCKPCTHICHCQSVNCTQSMHLTPKRFEEWNAVNIKQMEKTKRKRIRFGKVLPKLESYPKSFPDDPIYSLFGSTHTEPLVRNDTQLPTIKDLRKLIRKTGRQLLFPKLNIKILGIEDDKIFSEE